MLFDNLSPKTDFSSKKQLIKLEIIAGNILYITHEVDKIKKIVTRLELQLKLQKQVDDYFDETSHQTDIEDKIPPLDEQ